MANAQRDIIGSGPARPPSRFRANLQPLLFEGDAYVKAPTRRPADAMITTEVEITLLRGREGPDLMENARPGEMGPNVSKKSSPVDFSKRPYIWSARLSTRRRRSSSPPARARYSASQRTCSTTAASPPRFCDGFAFRARRSSSSAAAFRDGKFLTKFATKLTLVHRRESSALQDHADRLRESQGRPAQRSPEIVATTACGVKLGDTKTEP